MTVAYLILAVFLGGVMLGVVAMVAVAMRREARRFSLSGAAPGTAEDETRWLAAPAVQALTFGRAAGRADERLGRSRLKGRDCRPDGVDRPVEEVLQLETAQRARIDQDRACAPRKHRRLRWRIHWYVPAFDFCLLLYFLAAITGVKWASPVSPALALAASLAAIVTVLSCRFLASAGHRLRSHKNHADTIHREELGRFTSAAFVIALIVIAVLAMLVFLRFRSEVIAALGVQAQLTALVIAAGVAVRREDRRFSSLVWNRPGRDGRQLWGHRLAFGPAALDESAGRAMS